MLDHYLPLGAEGLTYSHLQDLVENRLSETETLELKRIRPNDRIKFARRIAAMANNGGGVLLIGVPDEKDPVRELHPVRLDQEEMTVQQIINARIEPPFTARPYRIPCPDDPSTGILAFEIPSLPRLPVVAIDAEHTYFEIRSGTEKRPLREREVERMYRARFQRLEEVEDRMNRLPGLIPGTDKSLQFQHATIRIVPLFPVDRLFRLSANEIGFMQSLLSPAQIRFSTSLQRFPHLANKLERFATVLRLAYFGQDVSLRTQHGFKRMQFSQSVFEPPQLIDNGWFDLHDDGALFAVLPAGHVSSVLQVAQKIEVHGWRDIEITLEVIRYLAIYAIFAAAYKLAGEVEIRFGIPRQADLQLVPATNDRARRIPTRPAREEFSTSYNIDIEMLSVGPSLLRTAKYLLDDFFSAFGWPECDVINDEGHLFAGAFRRDEWHSRWLSLAGELGVLPPVTPVPQVPH